MSRSIQTGFSYIELVVCLLIISSGIVGYTELIARVKYTQAQASEQLQEELVADYEAVSIKITDTKCQTFTRVSGFVSIN